MNKIAIHATSMINISLFFLLDLVENIGYEDEIVKKVLNAFTTEINIICHLRQKTCYVILIEGV